MLTHEQLEMLLFYPKPQGDTNPCAHALIERFGGLKGIFDASYDELIKVEGVGEHTAILLKLLPLIYRTYETEMHSTKEPFHTISRIVEFLHPYFVGASKEYVYLLLLNNRMDLIDCVLIAEGTVNKCEVLLRLISEKIHAKNATYVVMAHNHPNGTSTPSFDDVEMTNTVYHHLSAIDVVLLEHIVFTETDFYPIIKNALGKSYYEYELARQTKEKIVEGFYNINENVFRFPKLFDREQ